MPKVDDDYLISEILLDLFPGVSSINVQDSELVNQIEFVLSEKHFVHVPSQVSSFIVPVPSCSNMKNRSRLKVDIIQVVGLNCNILATKSHDRSIILLSVLTLKFLV